jgi:glucose/arabinose dehydrogenase
MRSLACLLVAACLALCVRSAAAQTDLPDGFTDLLIEDGLDLPTGMAFVDTRRLLVIEQRTARIRLIVNGELASIDPVVVVPEVETAGNEQGLLGIAVDPAFPARPYVYVHYDHAITDSMRITRFTAAGDLDFSGDGSLTIDPASAHQVLVIVPDVNEFHNGGTLRFGPDSMLYASFGEDGNGCAAQDTSGLRGVILRLDVSGLPDGPGGPPHRSAIAPPGNPFPSGGLNARLIWAFGLRNPFRFGIDPADGALYIGDVGQSQWEEVDRVPAGGLDFGWPRFEGNASRTAMCSLTLPHTPPIYAYPRVATSAAVICAGAYRAPAGAFLAFPSAYEGDVFVSDYYIGFLRRLKFSAGTWAIAPAVPGQPSASNWAEGFEFVSDYVVAADGSLWYCRQADGDFENPTGQIRRIVPITTLDVPDAPAPAAVTFAPPWPAPAHGAVHFAFTLSASAEVELVIFDLTGRRVRRLIDPGPQPARAHDVVWDGRDDAGQVLPAGIYRVRLTAGRERVERRVALVR